MGYCGTNGGDEGGVLRISPRDFTVTRAAGMPFGAYHFASGVIPDAAGAPVKSSGSGIVRR